MATLKDYRNERLRKLGELKAKGIYLYPAKAERTHMAQQIVDGFTELEGEQATVAGRIVAIRKFGKIAFLSVKDVTGALQLFLSGQKVVVENSANSQLDFADLPLLDTGDFIEASGSVIKTQTGEVSLDVTSLRLLTKALRPLPSVQEGFTNKEERLRRRYIDLHVNQEVRDRFIRRSKFWQANRDFLNENGFVEINTPVLEQTTGGADANPFVTHMDALGQDFYLRISQELPLKRLLGGGYEKVYDIGPRFRNENYSDEHLPEHIAMEWYWAYADWQDGMKFTQDMVRHIADDTWGRRQFTLMNGHKVDLGNDGEDWPRVSFVEVIRERYGLDVFDCTLEEAVTELKKIGGEVEKIDNRSRVIDKLWKKIRVEIAGPAFLVDIPTFLQPLAKLQSADPRLTEQFNLLLGGTEACKAYSELNDPIDQLNRFVEQQSMRDAGDDEAMMMDIDFVEMLEYGMPPACGYGHTERLFWMLEGVTAREGVIFPQLRAEIDEVTKGIYPELRLELPERAPLVQTQKEKPLSALEEGTKKLYLDDFSLQTCQAQVLEATQNEDGAVNIILDQSCFYPGGGGQACDVGVLSWNGGSLNVTKVSKDEQGTINHIGMLTGTLPQPATKIMGTIDTERRLLNSRLHSAGHIIDQAVQKLGKEWQPGKGAHYPDMSFVEYAGEFNADEAETLRLQIEQTVNDYIANGGAVTGTRMTPEDARKASKYIPEKVLQKYQQAHVVTYPENFAICCGGTHVQDISQVGSVEITKIKRKDGAIRVSYH